MKLQLSLLLFLADFLVLIHTQDQCENNDCDMPMVGGLTEPRQADDEVKRICREIRAELEQKVGGAFAEFEPVSYKSQVVAGTNYFIKIRVDGGKHVHVRVYESLPYDGQRLSVDGQQTDKTRDDPIEYFQ